MRLITDADKFEQAPEAQQQQPKQKELEHVTALLTDTEYEAEQIAETAKKIRGVVGEMLQAQAEEVNRRYQVLKARKVKLEEDLKSALTETHIADLIQFRQAVAVGLNHPTREERRLWLGYCKQELPLPTGLQ